MPIVRVRDFGKLALATDRHETLLQPGEWTDLDNIDIESGDIRSAWGDSLISGALPIQPTYIFVFEGVVDTWLVISDGARVYVYNGASWDDISPTDTPTTAQEWDADGDSIGNGTWDGAGDLQWDQTETGGSAAPFSGEVTFTVFLGTLVVNSSGGVPTYWPGETGRLQQIPGWNAAWRARQVVAFSNHLVAIAFDDGVTEGAKYRVAWSDAAAEGEVPQSWDPSNPLNSLAGSVQLRDSEGGLTVAQVLRDNLIIYKQSDIYRMYLRGDEFVMGFERVVSDRGCDSPNGVDNLGDVQFFADRGDLRIFNGQNTQSVAALRIKETLASAIDNESRDATYVVAYPERDQIHVGVVPAGDDKISQVLIYNTTHDAWTRKQYPGAISMTLGPISATKPADAPTWDEQTGQWDNAEDTWDGSALEPTEDSVVVGALAPEFQGNPIVYRADKTNTDYNNQPKSCRAEKRGIVFEDPSGFVTIRGVIPEIEGTAEVFISIGWQFAVGGPLRWTTPRLFRPGVDDHLPVRVTGRVLGFRISSVTSDGWRLGAVNYDVIPAGRR